MSALQMSGCRVVRTYLYVPGTHVMFVPLQGEVSVLLTHESHQSLSIPPTLGIQTKCCTSPLERSEQGAVWKKKIQSEKNDRQPMIPLGLLSKKIEIKKKPTWQYWVLWKTLQYLDPRTAMANPGLWLPCCRQQVPSCCCGSSKTSGCVFNARASDLLPHRKTICLFTHEVLFFWSVDRLLILPNLPCKIKDYLAQFKVMSRWFTIER